VQSVCSKFILGAVQGIKLAAAKLNDKTTFCIPDDMAARLLSVLASINPTVKIMIAADCFG
jgi:hypothetical protein